MTKIEYVARENRGISYISLAPSTNAPMRSRLGRVDRIMIAIVLSTYLGLFFCLVK